MKKRCLARKLAYLREQEKAYRAQAPMARILDAVEATLPVECEISTWGSGYVMARVDRFGDAVPILRTLRKIFGCAPTVPIVDPTSAERFWEYQLPIGKVHVRVILTGEKCQRVQIGEKTEVVPEYVRKIPIYKIVCK